MFIGHHAIGFAAKRFAPRASLGALIVAAMLLDLLWPVFLLLGWERMHIVPGYTAVSPFVFDSYPFSHSLVMTCVWSALFATGYWTLTRRGKSAIVIALAVLSHWALDAMSHRPDMPLAPGSTKLVGLGLWNSMSGTMVVEGMMFAVGLWLYLGATRPTDRIGTWSFVGFVAFLTASYVGSVVGPPPPGWRAVAWVSLAGWIIPLWAAWFDRHREPTRAQLRYRFRPVHGFIR